MGLAGWTRECSHMGLGLVNSTGHILNEGLVLVFVQAAVFQGIVSWCRSVR
jgi:hypothetical protein